MEFGEKLQQLRKQRGMTQEELAEALFVSRTAVSKWESGKGYPNIDSLKAIAKFFSVSIDGLLSGEEIVSLAEDESKSSTRRFCNMLFGTVDLFTIMLVVLPLYPNPIDGYTYSVCLVNYTGTTSFNRNVYWVIFLALVVLGVIKLLLTHFEKKRGNEMVTYVSLALGIIAVLFLGMTREAYAVTVAFALMVLKGAIVIKYTKNLP